MTLVRSFVLGQHDQPPGHLIGQCTELAGHCPMTAVIFNSVIGNIGLILLVCIHKLQ